MKERVLNLSEEYGWILERLEKGRPALFYFDDSLDKVVLEAAQNHPADDYLLFVEVAGEKKAEFLSKFEIKDAEGLIIVQKD